MKKNITAYRIKYLLHNSIDLIRRDKYININTEASQGIVNKDHILSLNSKRNQLMEQIIAQAIIHFTTCVWEKKEPTVAGDILSDLSSINGRRTVYGTFIKDSRG
jgi:hypothetical protein